MPGAARTAPGSTARPCRAPARCSALLRTVLFAPEDLALVKGDPDGRRRFLDELLVARAPRYRRRPGRLRAGAAAAQRAAEVRRAPRSAPAAATCAPSTSGTPTWPQSGAELLAGRLRAGAACWPPHVATAYEQVSRRSGRGRTGLPLQRCGEDVARPPSRRRSRAAAGRGCWRRWPGCRQPGARARRQPGRPAPRRPGAHAGQLPAKGYASHGESWSFALALRLAQLRAAACRRPAPTATGSRC